jgi:hypothetical protein
MIIDKYNPKDEGEIERQEFSVIPIENTYALIKYSDDNSYYIERVWAFSVNIFVFSEIDIKNPKLSHNPSFDRLNSMTELKPIMGGSNFSECGINDEWGDEIIFIGTKEECEKEKLEREDDKKQTSQAI